MYMSRARAGKRARWTEKGEGAGDSLQNGARPFCAQTLLSGLDIEGVNLQALVLQGSTAQRLTLSIPILEPPQDDP